jgi:hypothetical protein
MRIVKTYEGFRTEREREESQSEITNYQRKLYDEYGIENCRPRDDGSINASGNINLAGMLGDLKKLPLVFNEVMGNFLCDNNNLTTLEGCPKEIGGYFNCSNNKLASLEYSPKIVRNFLCQGNKNITSLEGLENTHINSRLVMINCSSLYSLKGFPRQVGSFYCKDTPIQPIYDTFIQEPDPEAISRFNRLRVIGTDGLDWWVYYDQLGKFLRSVDKEHLIMSEKDFDDFIKTTKYHWDY